jgi:two-component system, OmpR family, response regulator RstA
MLPTIHAMSQVPLPAHRDGVIRVAIATDDLDALQTWRSELETEGVAVDRMEAPATLNSLAALRHVHAQIYVLHLQTSVGCQLPQLRALRERVPLSPLAVWCKGMRDMDQVLALEVGADDVTDASTNCSVLAARLRALWRRCARGAGESSAPDELCFGRLSLQLHSRRATLGTSEVLLTEGEFDVLWLLASRAGTPVSRQDILRQVRGLDDSQLDRSIDSRVYRLRSKLRDGDKSLQRIRTVRNRGYVFSPEGW